MAPKRSVVWQHFVSISSTTARCLKCNKCVVTNNNTTNLKGHLKSHHHHVYLKLRDPTTNDEPSCVDLDVDSSASTTESATASFVAPSTSSQPCAEPIATSAHRQTLLSSQFFVPPKSELTKVSNAIACLLAATGTPFSIVEHQAFKRFMATLCPHYTVPCRTTFSERLIPKIYNDVQETVKLMLREVPFMSLTTDGWTGCNGSQFIAVTATFIDIDWNLKTLTLACRQLNMSHTGKNIAALIRDVLEEYAINEGRITAVTTDRGSNMINAVVKELLKPHIPCFAHVLNTFVQKVVENSFVSDVIAKVRALYNLTSHSSHARRVLKEVQTVHKLPNNKMPSSCPTRWWSEITQLQFVVAQEKALFAFCNEFNQGEHQQLAITSSDIKKVNVVLTFMLDLERTQKMLGGETIVTGSLIHPVLQRGEEIINKIGVKCLTVPGVFTFKQNVKALYCILKDTYKTDTSHLEMATFLDPRFERSNIIVLAPIIHLDSVPLTPLELVTDPQPKNPLNELQIFFGVDDEEMQTIPRTIDTEIDDYEKEKKVSLAENPLLWWKRKETNLPMLSKIAKKYLCMTATSVPSERVFSVGGNILTKDRYSLSDEHVEQLIFLAKNQQLINH